MKFRTELMDVRPLLAAIRKSPWWQDTIERLTQPETPPKEPEKKDPNGR